MSTWVTPDGPVAADTREVVARTAETQVAIGCIRILRGAGKDATARWHRGRNVSAAAQSPDRQDEMVARDEPRVSEAAAAD